MQGMTDVQALLAALQEKGWTKSAIAAELKVAFTTVYKWEKGIHPPKYAGPVRTVLEQLLEREAIPQRRRPATRQRHPNADAHKA
jgi:transcriptional regulator with XRE-family HTH domain